MRSPHAPRVFGFQSKPFDGKHLLDQVEQALRLSGVGPGEGEEDWRRDFVTQSPKMENVLHQARLVASRIERVHPGSERYGKGAPRARDTPREPPPRRDPS